VEDHQSNRFSDMCIGGLWSDAVTYLDYIREDDLNSNVAHYLETMQSYWKDKEDGASVPRVYTDEEERATTINYLKNVILLWKSLSLR